MGDDERCLWVIKSCVHWNVNPVISTFVMWVGLSAPLRCRHLLLIKPFVLLLKLILRKKVQVAFLAVRVIPLEGRLLRVIILGLIVAVNLLLVFHLFEVCIHHEIRSNQISENQVPLSEIFMWHFPIVINLFQLFNFLLV